MGFKSFTFIALALLLSFPSRGYTEDVSFVNCKLADAKGTQTKAALSFNDAANSIAIQVLGHASIAIPYANLDKVSYQYSKKHRITTGAILMALTPFGAGGLVMLTKSKSNWLYVDFHDQDGKETVVLKLERRDLVAISNAFKTHAGRDVVDLAGSGKA